MAGAAETFPLVPRYRLVGLSFGGMRSARRGIGDDVAGSREYRPGDDVDLIDWNASARRSSARATDEFVVRQTFADEAPRVVVLCDRRPAMAHFAPPLPWLDKAAALRETCRVICSSASSSRGLVGYLDLGDGEPFWRPPKSDRELWEIEERQLKAPFRAPADSIERGLDHLSQHRTGLPSGSFVFVLSDFLAPPPEEAWHRALGRRWDVVPVVIQDPVWEQSFPDVGRLVVPYLDPSGGGIAHVRLTRREASAKRTANEARLESLLAGLAGLGLDPVLVSSSEPAPILDGFVAWAADRFDRRGGPW